MVFYLPSFCPYLYKSLSVKLYYFNPCLQVLFLCPWPVTTEHQHRYTTGYTTADNYEVILIVPFAQSLESAEFATVYHGAMSIALRFM